MKVKNYHHELIIPLSWQRFSYGENYLSAIEKQFMPWWPKLFGCHLLKIGALSSEISTSCCNIAHQVNVGEKQDKLQIITSFNTLPFQAKSVDACLLAHTLNYTKNPHNLLREVDRILADDGWILLSGFNPISLIGLVKCIPIIRKKHPYNSRMFNLTRILDWLNLLNYEIISYKCFQFLPWKQGHFTLDKYLKIFGNLYIIVARKRSIPLISAKTKSHLFHPKFNYPVRASKIL